MSFWAFLSVTFAVLISIAYYEDSVTLFYACLYSFCMCVAFSYLQYSSLKNRVRKLEKKLKEREEK